MDKRYQVCVSSTYTDLKVERQKVIEAVIETNCIPAGMELFPAVDEEQFKFIKKVIDDCDYYILIIAARYGSITPEGLSYTEKEFDYAVSKKIHVIALIHENPGEISYDKSEIDPLLRERLQAFRKKVSTGRLVKTWKSIEDLQARAIVSLTNAIMEYPAIGWTRANRAASEDLLAEINDLRKQNAQLQEAAASPRIENLAGLEDKMRLYGKFRRNDPYRSYGKELWDVELTWAEIFAYVAPYMVNRPNDEYVKAILEKAAFGRSADFRYGDGPTMDDQVFRTVALQLEALGLVKRELLKTVTGTTAVFWSVTPSGERWMIELRTVKKTKALDKMLEQTKETKEVQ